MTKPPYAPLEPAHISTLPGPLFTLLSLYNSTDDPFRKVHRLIDTLEWAVKWHTVLAVSDLMREASLTSSLKVMFAYGLRSPSLGIWFQFYRESIQAVQKPLLPYQDWDRLLPLEKKNNLVSFRNRFAHGATPENEECLKDCEQYEPVLWQLIGSELFTKVNLAVSGERGVFILQGPKMDRSDADLPVNRSAALLPDNHILNLWPLGIYVREMAKTGKEHFFYFNSIKNKQIEQLNYELPSLQRDKALKPYFDQVFPLSEWGRTDSVDLEFIKDRIEALTERFKGRIEERRKIKDFCAEGRGALMLFGEPGIGKSALLAQVFQEIKGRLDTEGRPEERAYPEMIEYFIRRGYETEKSRVYLRYLCRKLDELFGLTGIAIGQEETEMWNNVHTRLRTIEEQNKSRPVVLFVDGLDENPEFYRFIPAPRSWLKVILASRPVKEITGWWKTWERDNPNKQDMEVRKLSTPEIRAILLDVVDKYTEEFNEEYILEVENRSQGNPLFLYLLCEKIFSQNGQVGDIAEIPKNIEQMYDETVKRLTNEGKNEDALNIIMLLTEAKGTLPVSAIAEFLEINTARADSGLDCIRELLFEDHSIQDTDAYQLFHESLRDWLKRKYPKESRLKAQTITDRCFIYSAIEDESARLYTLEHAAAHLFDLGDGERLWQLLCDEDYRKQQIEVFKQYTQAFESVKLGINHYIARNGISPDDDPRLCWLALRAGELGHKAKTDINDAFDWAQESPERINEALERLEVLDEVNFFKSALLLLWIEADRQGKLPEGERTDQYAQKIVEAVDHKIPGGSGTMDWEDFLSVDFMGWWAANVITGLGQGFTINLHRIVARCSDSSLADLTERLVKAAASQIKDSNSKQLLGVFYFALTVAEGISDDRYKSYVLSGVAEAMAQAGDYEHARHCFQKALTVAEGISDDKKKTNALYVFAKALAQAGDYEQVRHCFQKAMTITEGIGDDWKKYYALSLIAKAMAQAGDYEQALTVAEGISDDRYKSYVLSGVAEAMAQAGDYEHARHCFQKALTVAEGISDDEEKYNALSGIAKAMAQAGDYEQVRHCFQKILTVAEGISDDRCKSNALYRIAEAMAQAGDYEQALTVADGISYDVYKYKALSGIAKAMAQTGEFQQALTVADGISDDKEKSYALTRIAEAMAQTGKLKIFQQFLKSHPLSSESQQTVIPEWRALLNEHAKQNISLLRETLRFYPFNFDLSNNGVHSLYLAHLKAGNRNVFDNIILQCPQLKLDFLLQGIKKHEPDSSFDPEKLSSKLKAKYDTYLEMLNDGDITKEIFNAKVEALFALTEG